MDDNKVNVLKLFEDKRYLKICAPMVRYSKLPFRQLVQNYDCDLVFTPMILSDSFVLSENARNKEFTTSLSDSPLIVQFAASNVNDFVGASTLVSNYCNGVDLNCGCPQRWAKKLGLGCALMNDPELICSMIKEARSAINKQNFTISVKTRILNDLKQTVDLCCKLDRAGASFLTIHGRTPDCSTGPVNFEAIHLIKENVSCPVIANGGIETLEDCENMYNKTNCNGVMVANGLLTNPMLFSGKLLDNNSVQLLVEQWIIFCFINDLDFSQKKANLLELTSNSYVTFQCFHHHLVFMLSKVLLKTQRRIFNNLRTFPDVLEYICDNNLVPDAPFVHIDEFKVDNYKEQLIMYDTNNKYVQICNQSYHKEKEDQTHRENVTNGKFFQEFTLDDLFTE